jgi:hypothetical protein
MSTESQELYIYLPQKWYNIDEIWGIFFINLADTLPHERVGLKIEYKIEDDDIIKRKSQDDNLRIMFCTIFLWNCRLDRFEIRPFRPRKHTRTTEPDEFETP